MERLSASAIARYLAIFCLFIGAPGALAMSVSPATSTNGAYTVNWSAPTGCQSIWTGYDYITICYNLQVNSGNGWSYVPAVPDGSISKAFSGMASGVYQYQIEFSGYGTGVAEGPVSVTVANGPFFAIGDATVTEGGILSFTVTKTGSATTSYSVNYATADGTATIAGSDYTAVSGTLTFASTETSKTVSVPTTADTVYESNETLSVNLSGATGGATITDGQGVGTINNDDAAPGFSVNDVAVTEGGSLVFTVTRTGITALSHAVSYATANNTATVGSDYTSTSGTLTFASGETSKTVSVATTQDSVFEANETLYLNLSGPTNGATLIDGQGQGTINDDEVSFSINNASVAEGGALTFTVTRTGATTLSNAVTYATANGTATAGIDYTAVPATVLTFAVGETSKVVTVTTIQDTVFESNEALYVNLSAPTGVATISDSQGLGTINDDETNIRINDVTAMEGGVLSFTVSKSGGLAVSHTVTHATANGTATAGSDYTAIPATVLTFAVNQSSKTVTVQTATDTGYEFNETVKVNLTLPSIGAVIADSQGIGTIYDSAGYVLVPPVPISTSASIVPPAVVTATDTVGTVAGSFRVNESGAATYTIPIATVTGTAGVVPQISLSYSSQAGNGLLGVGWSIGGLSGITRCRQTLSQDHTAKGITLSSEDRFCLDGQRLLVTSGNYGAVGAVYKTEIDSFTKVTSVNGTPGHPAYFIVERKDGSKAFYGHTSDSKVMAGANTLTWALKWFQDSVEDASGVANGIQFFYDPAAPGRLLTQIRYAYGGGAGAHNAQIDFTYESTDRPDPIRGYVAGYEFQTTKRLASITSSNKMNEVWSNVRTYSLTYRSTASTANKLSRLESLEECTNTTCLPLTIFTWTLPQSGLSGTAQTTTITADGMANWRPADIDGDGRLDMVWERIVVDNTRFYHYLRVSVSNGTTLIDTGFEHYLGYTDYYVSGPKDYRGWSLIDYNGDGRQDIIVFGDFYTNKKNPRILLSRPQSDGTWRISGSAIDVDFAVESNDYITPVVVDVDSDGMADLLYSILNITQNAYEHYIRYLKRNSQPTSSNMAYSFTSAQLLTVNSNVDIDPYSAYGEMTMAGLNFVDSGSTLDINGDGRAEILANVHYFDGTWDWPALQLLTINGTSLDLAAAVALSGESKFSDINGDGLTDYITLINYTWSFALNTGSGFTTPQAIPGISGSYPENYPEIQVVDYNYDGYPDIVWQQGDYPNTSDNDILKVNLWNGSGYDSPIDIKSGLPDSNNTNNPVSNILMDMNGDGRSDYVQIKAGLSAYFKVFPNLDQNQPPGQITSITNGLGAMTSIAYESLSVTDAYTRIGGLTTTSATETICIDYFYTGFCYEAQTAALDSNAFYQALNDPFAGLNQPVTTTQDAPVLELMAPLYIVTQVASSAPANGDPNAISAIGYLYEQAKIQAAGRGMLGFKKLSTVDLQTGVMTETTYRQDYPYIGLPVTTKVFAMDSLNSPDRNELSSAANTWEIQGWQSSWVNTAASQGLAALGALQPYLKTSVEQTRDLIENGGGQGAVLSTVTTTNTYDDYGNPTQIMVTTSGGAKNFRKTTVNNFGASSYDREKGRLSRTTVTSERDEDGNGSYELTATRVSAFTYYTTGAITGLLKDEIIEPDNPAYTLTTTYSYDAWGNRVRAKVNGNGTIRCDVDTSVYDAIGRYVDVTYDCLGRKASQVLSRNSLGQPLSVKTFTDINGTSGVTTTHAYTSRGLLYFERNSSGSYTTSTLRYCGASDNCPAAAVYLAEVKAAGGGQSREHFDKLGRSVRKSALGFNGTTWAFTDTEYDNLGRVARQSEPYFAGDTAYWTVLTYDILGRVTLARLPDYVAGSNPSQVQTVHSGFTTTTTNAKGQQKIETVNALGEVITVEDEDLNTVSYGYDAQGNLRTTTVQAVDVATPVVTTINFDLISRKKDMTDPDQGFWEYQYNHFGELTRQTDALEQYNDLTYDGLGRLKTRKDYTAAGVLEADAQWFYDSALYGLGQMASVSDYVSGYTRTVTYDGYGRPSVTTTTLGADGSYSEKQTYDGYSRPYQTFDAARQSPIWNDNVVQTVYNAAGYVERLVDGVYVAGAPRRTFRQITTVDARGTVRNETLGGGVASTQRYVEEATGRVSDIISTDSLTNELQDLSYDWDLLGNLESREDQSGSKDLYESFQYDGLNRLRYATTENRITYALNTQEVQYDGLGNIRYKSDVGTYGYNYAGKPHAVNNAGGVDYGYDANGNNTSSTAAASPVIVQARSLAYTSFNQAKLITQGTHTTRFYYGPDRARYKRTDNDAGGTVTTLYLGSVEKLIQPGGGYQFKRYIGGVAILSQGYTSGHVPSGAPGQTLVLRDHLGSVDVLLAWHADGSVAVTQELSFDAWGQRRYASDWFTLTPQEVYSLAPAHNALTTRGFTNHEMVDEVGIIHMNGRIYDPRLGRFLQADPFIQDAADVQMYNRYSYTRNNPLNTTDPSGYFNLLDVFKIGIAVVASVVTYGIASAYLMTTTLACSLSGAITSAVLSGAAAGFMGGISMAAFSGASASEVFKAGLMGAISGGVFGGIGAASYGWGLGSKVAVHGLAGGVLNVLQGGKFGHGFISAGLTKFSSATWIAGIRGASLEKILGRTMVASVVGGTVSEITGGKFANGARTAAFAHLFNQESGNLKKLIDAQKELSSEGENLLKSIEKLRRKPYSDRTGGTITAWVKGATIGYGHKIQPAQWSIYKDGITQVQAEEIFRSDLSEFETAVNKSLTVSVSQAEFDALVMFAFNIGINNYARSSALTYINNPNTLTTCYSGIESAWKAFTLSGGNIMQGLINRRSSEWDVYKNGVYQGW